MPNQHKANTRIAAIATATLAVGFWYIRRTITDDANGRVKTKTVTGLALAPETTTKTYDQSHPGFFNAGKVTTATRAVAAQNLAGVALPQVNVSQSYDHDLAGRLVKTLHINVGPNVNGNSYTLETEYWLDGAVKRKRLANGAWTGQFTYDVAGRLLSLDNANATSSTEPDKFIASTLYNARGQTTSISYGDGTTTTFGYNEARGFLTRVLSQRGATLHLDQSYVRTARGLITQITSPQAGNDWTYGYDGLDRLVSADNDNGIVDDRVYAYDDADNMVRNSGLCAANPTMVYPVAGQRRPHAPTSICGTPVSYDANGNTLSYDVDGAGPQLPRAFTYDLENRPLIIILFTSTACGRGRCSGARAAMHRVRSRADVAALGIAA